MSQVLHGIYTNKVSVLHLNVVLHLYELSLAACRQPLAQPAAGLAWPEPCGACSIQGPQGTWEEGFSSGFSVQAPQCTEAVLLGPHHGADLSRLLSNFSCFPLLCLAESSGEGPSRHPRGQASTAPLGRPSRLLCRACPSLPATRGHGLPAPARPAVGVSLGSPMSALGLLPAPAPPVFCSSLYWLQPILCHSNALL